MRKSSYRELDYTFGQPMLTLRTTISLTQASVAERLSISRCAVAEWEAGQCYPKAFIALALQQRVWAFGREVEEIRVPSTWTLPQPWIFCPCSIKRWDDTKRPNLY